MEITQDTRVSDILAEYGDIADCRPALRSRVVGDSTVRQVPSFSRASHGMGCRTQKLWLVATLSGSTVNSFE